MPASAALTATGPTLSADETGDTAVAVAAACCSMLWYHQGGELLGGQRRCQQAITRTAPAPARHGALAWLRVSPGHMARSCCSVSMPRNGLGNSVSTSQATPRPDQASACGSTRLACDHVPARPDDLHQPASGKASTSPLAQYMRSGLASPYRTMSRSATQQDGLVTRPASRQNGEQVRQQCAVTCQAWANASRSTVAAASLRPRCIDGLRAKA